MSPQRGDFIKVKTGAACGIVPALGEIGRTGHPTPVMGSTKNPEDGPAPGSSAVEHLRFQIKGLPIESPIRQNPRLQIE